MLKQILDSAKLDLQTSAELLGVSPKIFQEWVAGNRSIPDSMVSRLSTVLGVSPLTLRSTRSEQRQQGDVAPAIWFKFRGNGLTDVDREYVLLIRHLGYYFDQLEQATDSRATGWQLIFENIRRETDLQAPPREQGRQAARIFRQLSGLDKGKTGIGEAFRGNLRNRGVLIIESPMPESSVEGCCFYLGATSLERPCLFSNSYKRTWFRGNHILLHELAHAIFDAYTDGASIDLFPLQNQEAQSSLSEERAQAFAQESLAPRDVLIHMSSTLGLNLHALTPKQLATLIAKTHTEQKTVISAALSNDLISPEEAEQYARFDIASDLSELSVRALTTEQFLKRHDSKKDEWRDRRNTTIYSRTLRLPANYIKRVVEATVAGQISPSKAAEFLMIDESTFYSRFGSQMPEYVE
ncbi:XRE family transcriptional regulator [Nitrospira defluvii]|uniref:Peptidase_M78 domain-containing protein n=1 Tax=Nitrospira defluvii TaxID=330214 RepID=A0ABN7M066_9BACT|nr:XRE family transcriptional regulator [Nitrospira defluvii]CAE6778313.1 Peptidase_M78 domain-containing protein [Nitrospira defluvii]